MRILVCGGRNYGNINPHRTDERLREYHYIQACLNDLIIEHSTFYVPNDNWLPTDIVIIEGGATGADQAAATFAHVNYCQHEQYPADWKKYGRGAGYIRNKQMLEEGKPDLVVAFPGGRGTDLMVELATRAGVKVLQMGTKGSDMSINTPPKFQTDKYEKMFCDRMGELRGFATPGQRAGILRDLLIEEQDWLSNMASEYEDIIEAQTTMDNLNGS
jgi:hypothetical protein